MNNYLASLILIFIFISAPAVAGNSGAEPKITATGQELYECPQNLMYKIQLTDGWFPPYSLDTPGYRFIGGQNGIVDLYSVSFRFMEASKNPYFPSDPRQFIICTYKHGYYQGTVPIIQPAVLDSKVEIQVEPYTKQCSFKNSEYPDAESCFVSWLSSCDVYCD